MNKSQLFEGKVDQIFPNLRHDLGVLSRTLFVEYFDDKYYPENVVVTGEAYIFDYKTLSTLKPEVLASGVGWTEGPVWSSE